MHLIQTGYNGKKGGGAKKGVGCNCEGEIDQTVLSTAASGTAEYFVSQSECPRIGAGSGQQILPDGGKNQGNNGETKASVRSACEVAGTILHKGRFQQRSVKFLRLAWTAASSAWLKATTRSQCFSRKTAIRVQRGLRCWSPRGFACEEAVSCHWG